ncbi:MAG: grasp-with-spasm system ATP-grasp peptide maturase [Adhaeribacter sp.]
MICIFSTAVDYSTTDVIRWLHYLGVKDVIRVNSQDPHPASQLRLDVTDDTFTFQIGGQTFRLRDLEAVWYRKGANWLCDQFFPVTVADHARFTAYLHHKLQAEEATLCTYLHQLVARQADVLGSAAKGNLNKLLVLQAAREAGLRTPGFYVSNHRKGIQRAFAQSPGLITKAMSDGLYFFEEQEVGTGYFSYTEALEPSVAESLPERLSPSFLQQHIAKQYELRVFFLAGTCYAMAIFSQADEQTKTDFRKYNEHKPNRCVPYLLPAGLSDKIASLFRLLDLNTGSADLLVDARGEYYFLEINPVGQFAMVSGPCHYYLEKQVALHLKHHAS